MLLDREFADAVEEELRETGDLADFERLYGPYTGRLILQEMEMPDFYQSYARKGYRNFGVSFDFFDCILGFIWKPDSRNRAEVWMDSQNEDPQVPDKDWIEFLFRLLTESVDPDGSMKEPVVCFCNDRGMLKAVPPAA